MFDTKDYKIYEDFTQLSDLVEAKTIFVNRTELYRKTFPYAMVFNDSKNEKYEISVKYKIYF